MILLWEVDSGNLVKTLSGHVNTIKSMAFSPDGNILASGGFDNVVKLWDVNTGNLKKDLGEHSDCIRAVVFSQEGTMLASSSYDGTIKLWDLTKESLISTLNGHSGDILSLAIDSEGRILASGSSDNTIKLWDIFKTNPFYKEIIENNSELFKPQTTLETIEGYNKRLFEQRNLYRKHLIEKKGGITEIIDRAKKEKPSVATTIPIKPYPILSIEDISLSKIPLMANDSAELLVSIKNTGPGAAEEVYIDLKCGTDQISHEPRKRVPTISENNDIQTVKIPIVAKSTIETGVTFFDINVTETNSKEKAQGKRFTFSTKGLPKPNLFIASFSGSEGKLSNSNNEINIREDVDVKLILKNVGEGTAEDVRVSVSPNQSGLKLLNVIYDERSIKDEQIIVIPKLDSAEQKTFVYTYYISPEFKDEELKFSLRAEEKYRKYGVNVIRSIPIDSILEKKELAVIPVQKSVVTLEKPKTEDILDLSIDVRQYIPETDTKNKDAVAVLIGNKNYSETDTVDFAHDDVEVVKLYLEKTFGYDKDRIIVRKDALLSDFRAIFGTEDNHHGKLSGLIIDGESDVFIYYSGHGRPNPKSEQPYFLPVDCRPAEVTVNGYSLDMFYKNVSKLKVKSLTIVIDACFSGWSEKGPQVRDASATIIKVKFPMFSKESTTLFTSAGNGELSYWYRDKKHSLFTYYFLKGLQKDADENKDNKITVGELKKYLDRNVPTMSNKLRNSVQRPEIYGTEEMVLIQYSK